MLPSVTDFDWSWPSGWTYISGQGTSHLAVQTPFSGGSGVITLRVKNDCGWTGSPAIHFVNVFSGFSIIIQPNPASDSFEVKIDDPESSEKLEGPIMNYLQVSLVDSPGNLLVDKVAQGEYMKIGIPSTLENGIYFVKIFYKDNVWTKQLIVQR